MARVLVCGFYGRGNAGDEAILQCIYETLRPAHEVGIALHLTDTHPGFREWYPYDDCTLLDDSTVGPMLEWGADALLIGGGGLSPGHGAHLALTMRMLGRPTLLAGTDNLDFCLESAGTPIPLARFDCFATQFRDCLANPDPSAFAAYMADFRYLGLRFTAGLERTCALGAAPALGADWAFALPTTPAQPPVEGPACAIVLRAWDERFHDHEFRFQVHRLFHGVRRAGLVPFLLPFSPEDEALALRLAPLLDAPLARHWWNPRAIKGVLANCALAVSVGRLHPLVFAAPLSIPTCHLSAPIADAARGRPLKCALLCQELGLPDFDGVDAFEAALAAGGIPPADPARLQDVMARYGAMASGVLAAIKGSRPAIGLDPAAAHIPAAGVAAADAAMPSGEAAA